jgi:hypothetical protein
MPDGAFAFSPMHSGPEAARLPLAHAVGQDRHLRARCPCCRQMAVLDASPWIEMRLGAQRLESFEDRLRCVCGSRRARLEIWSGAASQEARLKGGIWMFR